MVGSREVFVRRERVLPTAPPLITLPIVLIALLKFSEFGVHLFKARDGSSTWYFRFSPKAVLQVRDDGDWCWRQGTERWRREIAPFLARAEALVAEGGDDGGLAEARIDGRGGGGLLEGRRPFELRGPKRDADATESQPDAWGWPDAKEEA
jgi:hypothetical protein